MQTTTEQPTTDQPTSAPDPAPEIASLRIQLQAAHERIDDDREWRRRYMPGVH